MNLDFEKMDGLIPAIIQDNYTQKVLMLGFMNEEAYQKTIEKLQIGNYLLHVVWNCGRNVSLYLKKNKR